MEILMLIGGLLLLLAGGEILVRGAVGVAKAFNIPVLVIGLTIVSLGTSAPELLVSLKAALGGQPDISIGNVIGSNIANLALVLGVTAMIITIPVARNTLRIDWPVMALATAMFWIFSLDGLLDFVEGLVFVICLVMYMVFLFYHSRKAAKIEALEESLPELPDETSSMGVNILFVILGIVGLIFGAEFLVDGATHVARQLGVSEYVIGVTVVAFGTSVPELATSVMAAVKKQLDISVGNLIGSNIFNIFGILGTTAMVTDIPVNSSVLSEDIYWVSAITLAVFLFSIYRMQFKRWMGVLMFLAYVTYVYMMVT